MDPFTRVEAVAAPMDAANIDTDQIIPIHQLRDLQRPHGDYARSLFHNHRFGPDGSEDPTFVLNLPAYRQARILVAGDNFGCGSSREMAVWALRDFGFRVLIASGFGDIFLRNCAMNGVLTVTLPAATCGALRRQLHEAPGVVVSVDLPNQTVKGPDGVLHAFEIDAFRKACLLRGMDELDLALEQAVAIVAWEADRDRVSPWVAL